MNKVIRKTVTQLYDEYCENDRTGKAYATTKKQDSLWANYIKDKFGKRYIDEITVAEKYMTQFDMVEKKR